MSPRPQDRELTPEEREFLYPPEEVMLTRMPKFEEESRLRLWGGWCSSGIGGIALLAVGAAALLAHGLLKGDVR